MPSVGKDANPPIIRGFCRLMQDHLIILRFYRFEPVSIFYSESGTNA